MKAYARLGKPTKDKTRGGRTKDKGHRGSDAINTQTADYESGESRETQLEQIKHRDKGSKTKHKHMTQ